MGRAVRLVLAVLAAVALTPVAKGSAQVTALDLEGVEAPGVHLRAITAGIGVAVLPEYEGSEDYKGSLAPYFRAGWSNGMYAQLLGATLSGNILPDTVWELGPLLRYRAPRDNVTNDAVNEMQKINSAVEAGAFAGFKYKGWSARIEAAADLSGSYSGYVVTVKGGYARPLTDVLTVGLNLSGTYASDNYMSTYFGVSWENARLSGLKHYTAEGGLKDVDATLFGTYRFTPHWGLVGALRVGRLVGDAADSPIVEDEGNATQTLAAVLVTYTF